MRCPKCRAKNTELIDDGLVRYHCNECYTIYYQDGEIQEDEQ